MRVVSWNIRFGIEIAAAVGELELNPLLRDFDILLLQEMDEAGTAAIAESARAAWVFHAAAPHRVSGRDFGNAIVSRWPIANAVELLLPHQALMRGQPRSAIRATVDVAGRTVLTYSVHTEIRSLRLPKRVQQFTSIATDIREMNPQLAIVGGDFNTVTGRDVAVLREEMERATMTHMSTEAGPTFRRFKRGFHLDHIFARGFRATSCGEVTGIAASDHLPLWVDLVETGVGT